MDDLTFTLRSLCQRHGSGTRAARTERLRTLTLASGQLREAGFRQMQAISLKAKHVQVLLKLWEAEGLSAIALENRMAHLRWWADKIGKPGLMPTKIHNRRTQEVMRNGRAAQTR